MNFGRNCTPEIPFSFDEGADPECHVQPLLLNQFDEFDEIQPPLEIELEQ